MKITRLVAIAVIAGSSWLALQVGTGTAQIREQQPAEFPPASYKGKQYVDSKGCVFIRAGIDGDVAWVPRVSRDRKVICGFQPSLAQEAAEATDTAPAESTESVAAPAEAARPAARVAGTETVVSPKSPPRTAKPRVVRQTAPVRKPKRAAKPKVAAAPKPEPAAPEQVRLLVRVPKGGLCPGASPLAQPYLRGTDMRCGPQSERIVGPKVKVVAQNGQKVTKKVPIAPAAPAAAAPAATATQSVNTQTRIVPKHVAENRVNTRNVTVPKGYRPVWEDGRLNPHRAEQNLQGRADMLLVWTNTVPRRLIDRRTGKDVTAKMPLIYPYTSVAQQRAEVGEVTLVSKDGQLMKRIVRKPVYSSRSAPKKAVVPKTAPAKAAVKTKPLATPRYVQVGTYRVQANAQRAAQTIAGMGMRARIGTRRSGGQALMTVQAGPFKDTASLQRAVKRLHGAGYADAFVQ